MKSSKNRFLLFILLALFFAGRMTAQPKAVIKPMAYDFGEIAEGKVVEKIFVITNEGSDTLKINNVKASCGCTAAVIGKKILANAESTELKVSFDSTGKSGRQNKTITIDTNDPNNKIIKLLLTGNVLKNKNSKE